MTCFRASLNVALRVVHNLFSWAEYKIGYSLLTSFSCGSFIRRYWGFCDTSWQHTRLRKDARAFNVFWTFVYSRQTTARTQWTLRFCHLFGRKMVSKLRLKWLQEQRSISKVGRHYGIQALFQCHHPKLWTFMKGLEKHVQMQLTVYLHPVCSHLHRNVIEHRNDESKMQQLDTRSVRL